ncbi:hypothetical protein M885DRAFT_514006 [Pelagophyceae sp. CCMP2097]|nr:hypothetical protein M885DRAFT_514006 [Pelagophyceae sp. CCMP2097]
MYLRRGDARVGGPSNRPGWRPSLLETPSNGPCLQRPRKNPPWRSCIMPRGCGRSQVRR